MKIDPRLDPYTLRALAAVHTREAASMLGWLATMSDEEKRVNAWVVDAVKTHKESAADLRDKARHVERARRTLELDRRHGQ